MTVVYSIENIWNMNESGCFFKALPETGLVQKGKQNKPIVRTNRNLEKLGSLMFHEVEG